MEIEEFKFQALKNGRNDSVLCMSKLENIVRIK